MHAVSLVGQGAHICTRVTPGEHVTMQADACDAAPCACRIFDVIVHTTHTREPPGILMGQLALGIHGRGTGDHPSHEALTL